MAVEVHWFFSIVGTAHFHERWPYGPGTTFHPDLGVELDAEARSMPALAPIGGELIVLPDSTGKTCGVFLIPGPDETIALENDGFTGLAFYLRTLDLDDLVARFEDTVPAADVERLRKGLIPIAVSSGEEIALFAKESSTATTALAQFEVLFAPHRGSVVGAQPKSDYAKRLVDPAHRYRRMDPTAFYYRIWRSPGSTKIALAHSAHPMLFVATRRGLFELREERDRPFATTLDVTVNQTTTSISLLDASWAHHEVAPHGTSGDVDLELEKSSWKITQLPSFGESRTKQTFSGEVPFHFAAQSIYMKDADHADSWFVANTGPLRRFTEGNDVKPLLDGTPTYKEMYEWLVRVREREQFIWHVGWWGEHDFKLVSSQTRSTWGDLAADAAVLGWVRVMMWAQPFSTGKTATTNFVDHINSLTNGEAILDAQTLQYGSHHQKFTVVYLDPKNAAAFCGGVDLNPNRLDTAMHDIAGPYHDVHALLQGPVVQDFMRLFVERWDNHYEVDVARDKPKIGDTIWQVDKTLSGDVYVQVTRTIPKGTHGTVIGGVQGTLAGIRRAIQRAEQYIYIEDQYLVPYWGHVPYDKGTTQPFLDVGIVQDLIDALARVKFLLIVIPNHVTTLQNRYRRHEFLKALTKAAGDHASKVHVYYLARKWRGKRYVSPDIDASEAKTLEHSVVVPEDLEEDYDALGGEKPGASGAWPHKNEIYVHTKMFIIDDVYVKCGSMNFNRRGFTYDTEADFHAIDGAVERGRRKNALTWRKALFAEHGRADPGDVPDDIDDAFTWWVQRAEEKKRVKKYKWASGPAGPGPGRTRTFYDDTWRNIIDPDGS